MRTKTIGLIAHTEKAGVAKLARDVIGEFKERSLEVIVENETAKIAKREAGGSIVQIAQRSDLIVVLGGDGTILNVVAMAGKNLKPIFGINVGSLGFLTCVNSSAYREAVDAIVSGRISYSKRALLSVELRTNKRVLSTVHALNDAVISRGDLSRLIRLNAKVNGEALTEFNADGLIIATPTGSTAYSMAAGGPILNPAVHALILTPISPHTLTNRPIVIPQEAHVEVMLVSKDEGAMVSFDGQAGIALQPRDLIEVRASENKTRLIRFADRTYYDMLRKKLKWGES